MRKRTIMAATLSLLTLVATAPAAHAEPARSGCQAFGANVATLAQSSGADFGATASLVAGLFPLAFPTLVVQPEQELLCG